MHIIQMCVFCTVFLLISVFRSAAMSICCCSSAACRCECRFLSVLFLSQFDHLKFNSLHELFPSLAKPLPISNVKLRSVFSFCARIATAAFRSKSTIWKTYCLKSSYEFLVVFNETKLSFRLATLWHLYKDRTRAAQMLNVVWLNTKPSISRNNTR